MMKNWILVLALGLLLGLQASAGAVSLQWDSGKLTGATAVSVDGKLYDVLFKDGLGSALFGPNYEFVFPAYDQAITASTALFDQVFSGLPVLEQSMVTGVDSGTRGYVMTPFFFDPQWIAGDMEVVDLAVGTAYDSHNPNGTSVIDIIYSMTDTSSVPLYTWAVWSPGVEVSPTAVPEPSTMILLVAGLIGLAGSKLKRRR